MRSNRQFYVFIAICVVIFGWLAIYRAAFNSIERTDYTVYTAAGQAIIDGRDMYLAENARGWRYVYPPPFAILTVALARMPLALGALLWYLLAIASIGAAAVMSAALLGGAPIRRQPWLIYGLPLLGLSAVLMSGILRSQASPFVSFFMIATCCFHLKGRPVAAGFSLACAVLLKVFPIVLIIHFVMRRQWRAVLAAAAALALLGIVLPSLYWGWQFNLDQIARWIDVVGHPAVMENTERALNSSLYSQLLDAAKPRNQSLEALFLTLHVPAALARQAVAACAAVMLAVMWAASRRITSRMQKSLLCGAFICWSLLVSPIAEGHYFGALLLPLIVLIGCADQDIAQQRRKTRYLAIGTACMALAMALTWLAETSIWRPLCIVTLALWLLCVGLVWRGAASHSGSA